MVCVLVYGFKYSYLIRIVLNWSVWLRDRTLTDTTNPGHSGPGISGNEGFSAFPRSLELEPHHQIYFSVLPKTLPFCWSYCSTMEYNQCILKPDDWAGEGWVQLIDSVYDYIQLFLCNRASEFAVDKKANLLSNEPSCYVYGCFVKSEIIISIWRVRWRIQNGVESESERRKTCYLFLFSWN